MGVDYSASCHYGIAVDGKELQKLFGVHDPTDDLAQADTGMVLRFEGESYDNTMEMVEAICKKIAASYDYSANFYSDGEWEYTIGPKMPKASYSYDMGRFGISGGYKLTDLVARIDSMAQIELDLKKLGIDVSRGALLHVHGVVS